MTHLLQEASYSRLAVQFNEHSVVAALLVGYFGVLGIAEFAAWSGLVGSILYGSMVFLLFRFLLGCSLFVDLVQLRPTCALNAARTLPNGGNRFRLL
jgi:hypothetical protein